MPLVCKHNHQFASILFLCLTLPLASPRSLLPPLSLLCVLFTWLTRSLHAGSFVHQKAPAPGDCLLTFLSRAPQMNVSSVLLASLFFFFSSFHSVEMLSRLTGLPVQISGVLRRVHLQKSHRILPLRYVHHIFERVLCWVSVCECVRRKEFRVLLKDIS